MKLALPVDGIVPVSFDAPVVLFIFNHPEMTRRVFAAIREAKPSKLLVVSDGPRDRPGEAALCAETRVVFDPASMCTTSRLRRKLVAEELPLP